MPRGNTSVFGMYRDQEAVSSAVEVLKYVGFRIADIAILEPANTGSTDLAHVKRTKAPEGASTGALLGAIVGGVLGWLAGIGTIVMPGTAPFVAAACRLDDDHGRRPGRHDRDGRPDRRGSGLSVNASTSAPTRASSTSPLTRLELGGGLAVRLRRGGPDAARRGLGLRLDRKRRHRHQRARRRSARPDQGHALERPRLPGAPRRHRQLDRPRGRADLGAGVAAAPARARQLRRRRRSATRSSRSAAPSGSRRR